MGARAGARASEPLMPEPLGALPEPPRRREPAPAAGPAAPELEPQLLRRQPVALDAREATAIYQERLAFSPNRDRAKELLDRLADAERSGREDEARELLVRAVGAVSRRRDSVD